MVVRRTFIEHIKNPSLKKSHILFYLALFTLLLFIRAQAIFLHPMFWAEDGHIFFSEAYNLGLHSFITTYAGYLHTIPRIIAYSTLHLPYSVIPAVYSYIALAGVIFCAGTVLSERFPLPYKPLLALSVILIPTTGEAIGSICNLQNALTPLFLFLLFAKTPVNKKQAAFDYVILFLISFTGPYILIFYPLFLLQLFRKRNTHNFTLVAIATIATMTQFFLVLHEHRHLGHILTINLHSIELVIQALYLKIIAAPLFFRALPQYIILQFASLTLLTLYILYAGFSSDKYKVIIGCLFFLLCVALLSIFYAGLGTLPQYLNFIAGGRYFYLTTVILAWIFIISLSGNKVCKITSSLLLILMLSTSFMHFKFTVISHFNYHWPSYSKRINPSQAIKIPINPTGWYIDLNKKN